MIRNAELQMHDMLYKCEHTMTETNPSKIIIMCFIGILSSAKNQCKIWQALFSLQKKGEITVKNGHLPLPGVSHCSCVCKGNPFNVPNTVLFAIFRHFGYSLTGAHIATKLLFPLIWMCVCDQSKFIVCRMQVARLGLRVTQISLKWLLSVILPSIDIIVQNKHIKYTQLATNRRTGELKRVQCEGAWDELSHSPSICS